MDRKTRLLLGVLTIGVIAYRPACWFYEWVSETRSRHALDAQLGAFNLALSQVREQALIRQQAVGVRFTQTGCGAFADTGRLAWQWDGNDDPIGHGEWPDGLVVRNTFKSDRFFFGSDGACLVNAATNCTRGDIDLDGVVSTLAVLQRPNSGRTYTLLFDEKGSPFLEFDDF